MNRPKQRLPPSVLAAQSAAGFGGSARGYPVAPVEADAAATPVRLAATRALLLATTPEDVLAVLMTLVHDLGARIVPARLATDGTTLPMDLSLGLMEPMLPYAEPVSVTRMRLEAVLPQFLEDAKHTLNRMRVEHHQATEAEVDPLTGLLTRRAWLRGVNAGDRAGTLALIDLDGFKTVNDAHGHAVGDSVLQAAAALLRDLLRDGDAAGRYGGDEFACMARGLDPAELTARLNSMRQLWLVTQPVSDTPIGLSIGVAEVRDGNLRTALRAADRALYRVKNAGGNVTGIAGDLDYRSAGAEGHRP